MGAVLGDGALVENDDGVGIPDCAESVGDDDHGLGDGFVLQDLVECLLDLMLGFGIKSAGCLV